MTTRLPPLIAAVLGAAVGLAPAQAWAEVPEILWGQGLYSSPYPCWVAEASAVLDEGLNPALVDDDDRQVLGAHLESARQAGGASDSPANAECEVAMRPSDDNAGAFRGTDARAVLREAKSVYFGTAVAVKAGLFLGKPATMVEVAVSGRAVGSDEHPRLFVVFSEARFRIGSTFLCTQLNDRRGVPAIGSSVALVLHRPLDGPLVVTEAADGSPVIAPQQYEVLVEDNAGNAANYGRLKATPLTLRALRVKLRVQSRLAERE